MHAWLRDLAIRKKVLGAEHPDTLTGRVYLARWTGEAGDPADARGQFAAQQFAVAGHNGQQIVEIAGNAAGQSPDGLHFLRVTGQVRHLAVARNIAEQHHRAAQLAVGIANGRGVGFDRSFRALPQGEHRVAAEPEDFPFA